LGADRGGRWPREKIMVYWTSERVTKERFVGVEGEDKVGWVTNGEWGGTSKTRGQRQERANSLGKKKKGEVSDFDSQVQKI